MYVEFLELLHGVTRSS